MEDKTYFSSFLRFFFHNIYMIFCVNVSLVCESYELPFVKRIYA